jgi:peptidoglycan/LPS O-acetylase OafA/YrhL
VFAGQFDHDPGRAASRRAPVRIDMSTPSNLPQVGLRRDNFDLLRILVAVLVLTNHATLHLGLDKHFTRLISFFPGVPIFFVISGFLVSKSYERSSSLWSYARSRLLRIFPGLWVCVLLTIPVATYFGYDFLHLRGLAWLVAQLCGAIYTPGFLKSFGFGSYNGSLWTIPLVLQFYVLLPVAYFVLSKRGDLTRGLAMLAIRANALIIPMCCVWDHEKQKYVAHYGSTFVEAAAGADRNEEILRMTAELTIQMEEFVRMAPDQWIWTHKRWKTRPPGEDPIY